MNKSEILNLVKQKLTEKISILENLIAETRASNNDTKSSMGDKYETGREMLQQEINNLQVQLNEVLNQKAVLESLERTISKKSEKVEKGAVVKTENGLFFISVSAGEIVFDSQKLIAISAESPLAKAMLGKTSGESFLLNGKSQTVQNIW